ncbi:hypothetical protein CBER1_08924 [Cercospora berteroae]|uniref:Uncharacterized protein n=1 Tax=Cercospora berteroae TaxID=357750 RepID=A0A2S6BUZ7_9PEZI|nr:hypothetical protein CBER1_08924 [Cercospora berteroae]
MDDFSTAGTMDDDLSRDELRAMLSRVGYLPAELWDETFNYIHPAEANDAPSTPTNILWSIGERGDPCVPPKDGKCLLDDTMPMEVLREVISAMLPPKDILIKCVCGEVETEAPSSEPRRNRVSDLMTVNKKFRDTIKTIIYEERFFEVHVHQGGTGGVEFLDAGYQPLAYCESASDDRFEKFSVHDEYGFQMVKKIEIKIFPTTAKRCKAVTLNTYFMIQALCRLLERGGQEEDRIVNISITFPQGEPSTNSHNRHSIMADEHYWWDPTTREPRCTSIHRIPDIELVLHPFTMLTRVHNVNIELPPMVRQHAPTVNFVSGLVAGMRSKSSLPTLLLSREQEISIQCMRSEVELYLYRQKHGKSQQDVEDMGEEEMEDETPEDDDEDDDLQAAIMASMTSFGAGPPRIFHEGNGAGDTYSSTINSIPLTGQLHRERRAATAEDDGLNSTSLRSRRNRLLTNRFHPGGRSQSQSISPTLMRSHSLERTPGYDGNDSQQNGNSAHTQLLFSPEQVEPTVRERTEMIEEAFNMAQRGAASAENHRSSASRSWLSRLLGTARTGSDDEMTGV